MLAIIQKQGFTREQREEMIEKLDRTVMLLDSAYPSKWQQLKDW